MANGKVILPGQKQFDLDDPKLNQHVANAMQNNNDIRLALEFECGGCCSKVENGALVVIGLDTSPSGGFVALLSAENENLIWQVFSGGKTIVKQTLDRILIPFNRLCALEEQNFIKD